MPGYRTNGTSGSCVHTFTPASYILAYFRLERLQYNPPHVPMVTRAFVETKNYYSVILALR